MTSEALKSFAPVTVQCMRRFPNRQKGAENQQKWGKLRFYTGVSPFVLNVDAGQYI